jgi:hypothetical protein
LLIEDDGLREPIDGIIDLHKVTYIPVTAKQVDGFPIAQACQKRGNGAKRILQQQALAIQIGDVQRNTADPL